MNQLLRLLADNRRAPRNFSVNASADEATVYLYDMIVSDVMMAEFFGGVAPQTFIEALSVIHVPTIHVRINSPGGDIFAARAIEQSLREHPSNIVVHVDGYAASAASIVAMAGDQIEIAPGGFIMIHNAWTMAFGNSADMLDTAALLEKIDGTLAQTYADKTGKSEETIRAMMAAETWLNGPDAVEAGFADKIAEPAAKAQAHWDMAAYSNAPKAPIAAAAPVEPIMLKVPDNSITESLKRKLSIRQGCRKVA